MICDTREGMKLQGYLFTALPYMTFVYTAMLRLPAFCV